MKLILHFVVTDEGEQAHPFDVELQAVEFTRTTFIGQPAWTWDPLVREHVNERVWEAFERKLPDPETV